MNLRWCLRTICVFAATLPCLGNIAAAQSPSWVRKSPTNHGVIVFVHGIMGDGRNSWASGNAYWPEMLTHDHTFDGQDVFVYDYSSPGLSEAFSINELADNMRVVLAREGVLGHDDITFVSHSMGGIVTRAFILRYRKDVATKIRLLYFFATPTTGSSYAQIAGLFSGNPQFKQLLPMDDANSYLANQQSDWLAANLGLHSYCAFEKKKIHGQLIVERSSATQLCNERPDPIDADHITIVKPKNQSSLSYMALAVAFTETQKPSHASSHTRLAPPKSSLDTGSQHKAPSSSSKPEVTLEDQGFNLADEIDNWYQKTKIDRPNELFSKAQFDYDAETAKQFRHKYDATLQQIIPKLRHCGVDLTDVDSWSKQVNHYNGIQSLGMSLRLAAQRIPEGQIECGTGPVRPGFEIGNNGLYTLTYGETTIGNTRKELELAYQRSIPFSLGSGTNSIGIYLRNDVLCVDANVVLGFDTEKVVVKCNKVEEVPRNWDVNYSDTELELVNENEVPMLQIVRRPARAINIYGVFPTRNKNELHVIGKGYSEMLTIDPSKPIYIEKPPVTIFKYPSDRHKGEYAH